MAQPRHYLSCWLGVPDENGAKTRLLGHPAPSTNSTKGIARFCTFSNIVVQQDAESLGLVRRCTGDHGDRPDKKPPGGIRWLPRRKQPRRRPRRRPPRRPPRRSRLSAGPCTARAAQECKKGRPAAGPVHFCQPPLTHEGSVIARPTRLGQSSRGPEGRSDPLPGSPLLS